MRKNILTCWLGVLILAAVAFGAYTIVDGPFFELDGHSIISGSTRTVDIFGSHTWDASAKCTDPCLGSTYPYATITIQVGFNNGPCSTSDPVTTNYSGGSGTSAGVPYIWVQAISTDKEFPAGRTEYDEDTCDQRNYVGGGGNFYCA